MATLEKIRKNGALLAIVIGGALLAFILGDMIRSGKSLFGSSKFHVAVVNDKSIDINNYQNKISETEEYVKIIRGVNNLDEQTDHQIRSSVWDLEIRKKLLEDTYNQLGISISKDELKDMLIGNDVSPMVRQIFVNPKTGQFDRNMVVNVIQNIDKDPKIKSLLYYIEAYIKQERKYTKYTNLITKGLYVTKLEVAEDNQDRKHMVDIDLVGKTIAGISDDQITYTNEDLQKYYDAHKFLFKNKEETRDISYIIFDVIPTAKDSAIVKKKAEAVKKDLFKSNNEQSIVNVRSSKPQPIRYYSDKELKTLGLDTIVSKMKAGEVYGPYLKYGSYNLVKVINREERPDTVSARHILISPNNPKVGSMVRAQAIADSLVTVLKNGGDFTSLVAKYSDDSGSKDKGGLYKNFTEGSMVKEFNDYCFSHKVGEIGTVETKYGIHIIEVTERKSLETKTKLALIQFSIDASQATHDKVYSAATAVRSKITDAASFAKIVQKQNLVLREAPDINPGVYSIPGLDNTREIVKWAFNPDTKKGSISNVFETPDNCVIALLKNINEKGYLSLEKVKLQVVNSVKEQKKVEKIYKDYFTNVQTKDLNALATKLKTQVLPIPNVTFSAFQLANIGYEPEVLASVSIIKKDQTMGPIKGTNGVYVIKATKIQAAPTLTPQQVQMQQRTMIGTLKMRAGYQAYTALKDAATIIDRRANFF